MPAILGRDKKKYVPKEAIRIQNKYGGNFGKAIYLPKGDGIESIFNFFNTNKDAIKSVTDTVSNVASAVGSVAKFGTDTAKGIEELKSIRQRNIAHQPLTDNALKNILNNEGGVAPGVAPLRVARVDANSIKKSIRAEPRSFPGSGFYKC